MGRLVALELGMAHQGADPDGLARHLDGVEAGDAVDVDEVRGGGQPHVEDRDEALASGEDLAVMADLAEDGDGLLEGAGCVVHEGGGLHRTDPAVSGVGKLGVLLRCAQIGLATSAECP